MAQAKPENKTGICFQCHEQVCPFCGECKYCHGHKKDCAPPKKIVASAQL